MEQRDDRERQLEMEHRVLGARVPGPMRSVRARSARPPNWACAVPNCARTALAAEAHRAPRKSARVQQPPVANRAAPSRPRETSRHATRSGREPDAQGTSLMLAVLATRCLRASCVYKRCECTGRAARSAKATRSNGSPDRGRAIVFCPSRSKLRMPRM